MVDLKYLQGTGCKTEKLSTSSFRKNAKHYHFQPNLLWSFLSAALCGM